MCQKYEDASKVVDEAKGGKIPTKKQIAQYTDISVVLEKACYVKCYIDAIHVERTGRDIHSRRFFLKVDDRHEDRLKVLAKNLTVGIDALDLLRARASALHVETNPRPDRTDAAIPPSAVDTISTNQLLSSEAVVTKSLDYIAGGSQRDSLVDIKANKRWSSEVENEQDLIDLELRRQKATILYSLDFIMDPDFIAAAIAKRVGGDLKDPRFRHDFTTVQNAMRQYALRIMFYSPDLFLKAEGTMSLKDILLSDELSLYDMVRFLILLREGSEFGLPWMKDAIVETLSTTSTGLSENMENADDLTNQVKILDGWIYNIKKTPNEAWYHLFKTNSIPANTENRRVRFCNTYNDLISVLSFGALGLYPAPAFCREAPLYRAHLSLSGVVIVDMVSVPKKPGVLPCSTPQPPQKPGHRTWVQIEARSYMFGAIRHEPDAFTDAFLHELKSRPDLFQIMIRSDTDPGQDVEVYGPSLSGEPIPQWRGRRFEVPSEIVRPDPRGEWDMVARTAKDILYGTDSKLPGYLTQSNHGASAGSFFRSKKFPVRYIVIMDAIPNRSITPLAAQVAWAALRAHGYVKGDYGRRKYVTASNALFDKCAKERLGWLPAGSWRTTKDDNGMSHRIRW